MPLKPLDLLVCLDLAVGGGPFQTYAEIGGTVGLSASEASQAALRGVRAGLLQAPQSKHSKPTANVGALLEFLEHGVRYAFFASPGKVARGMPTARSAPPLDALVQGGTELPLVWPDHDGTVRGQSIEPLYKTVPQAARRNQRLYELLALVDALRCGTARERALAMKELELRITDGIPR